MQMRVYECTWPMSGYTRLIEAANELTARVAFVKALFKDEATGAHARAVVVDEWKPGDAVIWRSRFPYDNCAVLMRAHIAMSDIAICHRYTGAWESLRVRTRLLRRVGQSLLPRQEGGSS